MRGIKNPVPARLFILSMVIFMLAGCKACQKTTVVPKTNTVKGKKMTISETGNIGLIEYSPQYPIPKIKPGKFYALYNERKQTPLNTVFYYMVKEHNEVNETAFLDSVVTFDYNMVMTYGQEHFGYGRWKGAKHIGSNKITKETSVTAQQKEFKILTVSAQYDYRENAVKKDAPVIYTRTFQVIYHTGDGYIFEVAIPGNRIVTPNGMGDATQIDIRSIKAFLEDYTRILR